MQQFTQEALMQYLYKETSQELTLAIEKALEEDWELREELKLLNRTIRQLDTLNLRSPRKESVNAILNYANTTNEVEHQH
jgi:hypothetical protein